MDFIAADTATLSEADAYKVQFAVHDRLDRRRPGCSPAGRWRSPCRTQYEPLKLSGPVFAGIYQSGVRQSGAVFEKGWPIKAGIEPELVARMSKDAPAGSTALYRRHHPPFVANLYCGMELVDNRYVDVTKMSGPGRIADDVLQAACVIGTEIKDWQKLDFPDLKGRSELDGKEIGERARQRTSWAAP